MIALPIVERELRVAARKRSTFWLRVIAALIALIIGGGVFVIGLFPFSGRSQLGGPIFSTLTWLCLVVALLAGVFFTSDCLSEEKREGTLGFLFLTDLRGYDVVLGKLLATSLRAVFALLAVFPMLAITQLLGGVEVGEFWRTLLALLNALFFSLAAGMFVSSLSQDGQQAMGWTFVLMLLVIAGGPIADSLIAKYGSVGRFEPRFSLASPAFAFVMAGRWANSFWPAFEVSHALAWVLLAGACALIPRTWQQRATKKSVARSNFSFRWRYGGEKRRVRLREKLLSRDPILWLASRERWQSVSIWLISLLGVGGIAATAILAYWFEWVGDLWRLWTILAWLLLLVMYMGAASQSARFLADARRNGLLELLLSTPVDGKSVALGQWRAMLRMFSLPIGLLLGGLVCVTVLSRSGWSSMMQNQHGTGLSVAEIVSVLVTIVSGIAIPLANLVALVWFGMWMGLTSKNANFATLKTLLFVQIIPWFVFSFLGAVVPMFFLIPLLTQINSGDSSSYMMWYVAIQGALNSVLFIGKDVVFALVARKNLYRRFRELSVKALSPVRVQPLPPPLPPRLPAPPPIQTAGAA